MKRRQFASALLPATLLGPRTSRAASNAAGQIRVYPTEPIGTISPLLHGHFVEHLGGVVYDGVWVGEGSKIPNTGGVRQALIDAMRQLGSTVIRWPGGCFADSYDWRDGVGPRNFRPRKNNFWANNGRMQSLADTHPAKNDTNHFGTNEFLRFAKLAGCEPYLAANVRSLTAGDFYNWVEYCNSPAGASTWAAKRAAWGDAAPFDVRFWGIGNESWGCGGNLTAHEYSVEFRKFISWVPRYGKPLSFLAAGPNGNDVRWTREFFEAIAAKSPGLFDRIWGWCAHYYCGGVGRGKATGFTTQEHYDLLTSANRMEELITQQWAVMGEVDRQHKVKLVIDEWGAWHEDVTAVAPHHLFGSLQSMRDALVAALTLDTFHRHADKVAMGNVAQLVNCIQTLFLAHEDKFCRTPVYHVFALYRDHHEGNAVRADFNAARLGALPRLAGAASMKGKRATITATNTSHEDGLETVIAVEGARVRTATAQVLAAEPGDYNDFSAPDRVVPQPASATVTADGTVRLTLPRAAVARISVDLL